MVVRVSIERFMYDNCLIRANAIAYSVVISIIPFLTVLVKYAEVDQDTIRANLSRFMAAYGVTDSTEVLRIVDEILSRANAIAGVGTAFMIISAANVLRNYEDTFNHIYRAKHERPFVYRFSLYIASLVILPGMILLFGSGLRYTMNRLQPPELANVTRFENRIYMTSGQSRITITETESKNSEVIDLLEKVDVHTPFREVYFDLKNGKSGRFWEITGEALPKIKIETRDILSLKKITANRNDVYAISDSGVLFYSSDRGKTWRHNIFGFKVDTAVRSPILEDIVLLENGQLIILATQGSQSCLIFRDNENQFRLRMLDAIYRQISLLKSQGKGQDIFMPGLYLVGMGRYLYSHDGEDWTGPFEEKFGNRSVEIRSLQQDKSGKVFLAGSEGGIWIRREGQDVLYPDLRIHGSDRIQGMHIFPDGSGFIYGEKGLFRWSMDGITWHNTLSPEIRQSSLLSHTVLPDGSIMLVGRNQTMIQTRFSGLSEQRDANGYRYAEMEILASRHYPVTLALFQASILFLLAFGIAFTLFLLTYKYLPNAMVEWKPAAIGALITSTALLAFYLSFQSYVNDFSSTAYIYGVWAAVPVGMLVILISVQISLFGLELAFVIQHPHVRPETRGISRRETGSLFWNTASLLALVYREWDKTRKPLRKAAALDYIVDPPLLEAAFDVLLRMELVGQNRLTDEYYPVRPAREVKLREIQALLLKNAANIPDVFPYELRSKIGALQKKLTGLTLEKMGNLSIADLVKLLEIGETQSGN